MASLHSLRPVALALGLVLAGCNQGRRTIRNSRPAPIRRFRNRSTSFCRR